jgi:hypothetical protein
MHSAVVHLPFVYFRISFCINVISKERNVNKWGIQVNMIHNHEVFSIKYTDKLKNREKDT